MKTAFAVLVLVVLGVAPAAAKVGDPVTAFMGGPLIHQLQLNPQGQTGLTGELAGRALHRFISDDRVITVDLVVKGGIIEQQVMYLPMDIQRGYQVGIFLQDAVGSVVGAQKGMIAFRAALVNKKETYLTFAVYTMRFTPMEGGLLRVLVYR